jgi:hypothetical protein
MIICWWDISAQERSYGALSPHDPSLQPSTTKTESKRKRWYYYLISCQCWLGVLMDSYWLNKRPFLIHVLGCEESFVDRWIYFFIFFSLFYFVVWHSNSWLIIKYFLIFSSMSLVKWSKREKKEMNWVGIWCRFMCVQD